MRFKNILKYIAFSLFLVPFGAVACQSNPLPQNNISPKYILNGSQEATFGNFVYYSINGGTEYAVALKESAKSSTAPITILDEYNSKPVTGIWRYGFSNSNATSISIPSGITVIDFEAFMNSKIQSVTIPATITEIGEAAFYSCKKMTKAVIHNTTTTSEVSSACSCIEVVDNDEEVRTPCTLTNIPSFCFFNCSSLKELVLPQSIEEIEYEAFNGCRSLFSTLAFMNIKAIRSRAFQGCASLKNIYISSSFFVKDQETNLPIGIIGDKAFDDCNSSLKFWLVGATQDVQDWLDLHTDNKWRWKNETTNPATNYYTYEITPSGASYSNDWIYTTTNGEVEITSYIGPTEIEDEPIKFLSFPNELPSGSGNKVRRVALNALDTVKANLERIYLPTTLKRIESGMFDSSYDNLYVVDDNTKCSGDEELIENEEQLEKRIVLKGITDLEVIGNNAFVNMDKLAVITKLHLPYSLKAVGVRAFGTSETDGKHMKAVINFIWDYDDDNSALKTIGREAFYKLGNGDNSRSFTSGVHRGHLSKTGAENYKLTTLVIPRTFEHFGITTNDNNTYNVGGGESNDASFGISAFAGCPLLGEVVFKGSKKSKVQSSPTTNDTETYNLVIASQTFVVNESLRTIVFEERCNKSILFHTAGGTYQPAIGWSAGKAKNDFGGDPGIQTIVLPNRYTTIRMQKYAMQGNSRAAVYFSGTVDSKIYGSTTDKCANSISNISQNQTGIANVPQWCLIGDENSYNNTTTYPGYNFSVSTTQNRFGIAQNMPIYNEVLYEDTLDAPGVDNVDVFVGVGPTNSANKFVVEDKCAFVCGASTATMTKYLYDRYDAYVNPGDFNGTAKVPAVVNSGACTVNAIGASAFSAAYCDSTSYANDTLHKNLTAVCVPDTIATIGEYAFMRAYGLTNFYSYDPSTGTPHADYVMPSSLTSIGKQAFMCCNIKQFLNIPDGCLFYENTNATTYETSVFSNNFSLRKITFGNNADSSTYYTTTTYTHSGSATVYTSALYSTSAGAITSNASSLLLVLNRDNADRLSTSAEVSDETVTINGTPTHCATLDGQYANNYLYGAFKMCYWIDSLVVGSASNNALNQPLISGLDDNNGHKDNVIYLNQANNFTSKTCNLKSISFGTATTIATPPYSFEGCEQLVRVKLPRVVGGHIPAGLFASIPNSNIVFEVPSDASGNNFVARDPGVLDLTYTGYTSIDAEAFKETNLTKVIAPITTDFTLEQDSFASCTSLTEFDFSNVTNSVVLNASFRGSTIPDSLFDFGSAAITFGAETFKGCTFTGTKTFSFPENTAIIGDYCFENCSTLENVTADAALTHMQRVVVDNGEGQNNAGNNVGFKQIGDYAFNMCTNLKNFDFSKFTQLERIGHFAFGMKAPDNGKIDFTKAGASNDACICTDGIVELPETLTNIGVGAFHTSKVTKVTFKSHSIKFERANDYTSSTRLKIDKNNGGSQFRFCYELTTVFFEDPDCAWTTPYLLKSENGQDNYFSKCTKLTAVFLPTGYDIQYERYTAASNNQNGPRPDSMVWESNSSVKFYVYHTVNDLRDDKPAINVFWHRTGSGDPAPIVFYAITNDDIVKLDGGVYKEIRQGTVYWSFDSNGDPVYLGTASVNSSTGLVTFQTAGYTADSTGVHHS